MVVTSGIKLNLWVLRIGIGSANKSVGGRAYGPAPAAWIIGAYIGKSNIATAANTGATGGKIGAGYIKVLHATNINIINVKVIAIAIDGLKFYAYFCLSGVGR